jgi:hypothetical protein
MISLLADENFNNHVVRGVLRQKPDADLVRVQDIGMTGTEDFALLGWAAEQNRVLLTHDVRTIPDTINKRLSEGLRVAGAILVPQPFSVAEVIGDLLVVIYCYDSKELDDSWLYLPLR